MELSAEERGWIVALALGSSALSLALLELAGMPGLAIALALMFTGVIAAQLLVRRKLTKTIESNYRRTEALLALYRALPGSEPVPALRAYMASPELLAELLRLVRERRPKLVVELGSGVSTLLTARCLAELGEGGRVMSFDHEARFAGETSERLERAGLSDVARVEHAPLTPLDVDGVNVDWYDRDVLASIPDGGVDLLLVDGPPGRDQRLARYPALPQLLGKLSGDAVVVLDDAGRPDEQEILKRWQARFPDMQHDYLDTEKGTGIVRRRH